MRQWVGGRIAHSGVAVVAGCLLFAGCGSSNSSSGQSGNGTPPSEGNSEPSSEKLYEKTPAATGPISEFTWDLPFGETASLDPAFSFDYSENSVLNNVCDTLLRQTPERTFEPALAEKVTHPSPLVWEYTIRKGVKYFDGDELKPSDVVFNLKRMTDPELGSYYYSSFAAQITSVKQTAFDVVTVKTEKPNTLINEMMSTGMGTIVEPKSIEEGKKFGTPQGSLECTGPFELQSWNPGSDITLVKNPNYWDKALQPKADKVKFLFISDRTALANALISGEVDGTYEAPLTAIDRLRESGVGKLYLGYSTQGISVSPFGNPVTSNPKIREAIYAVIDRAGIAETAFEGTATPVKSTATPDASPFGKKIFSDFYKTVPEPGPDLEKAKKLVEEAGSPTAPIRTAVSSGDPAMLQAANAIQSAAQEVGLNIEIVPLPPAQAIGLATDPTSHERFDMYLTNTFYDVPNILEFYSLTVLPGVLTNISHYENPAVTKAIYRGLATTNGDKRAEAIVEVAEHLDKELPFMPILRTPERLFMNNKIAGAPATFPYLYYPWAALVGAGSESNGG
jgi:peptide/nickel transport system substrate-binding protein